MPVHTTLSVCTHNCPDACAMRVGVEDGRIVSIAGDPTHPITRGFLCGKVNRYAERVYHPERIRTPLRRVGAKGEGRFAPISWDAALDEIAARWREVIDRHGAEAILPYSYSGTVGRVQMHAGHRLFHALGATRLARTICSVQAAEGQKYTTGAGLAADIEELPHSRLIVLWGSNVLSTHLHLWPLIREARANGAQLVVIDPHRNRTARQADWYLPIRPGTDAALGLGLMRELIAAGLHEADFVERYTLGFAELRAACAPYTPERTAELTGLAPEDVVRLAHLYGGTKASFLRLGLGPTRRRNGGMVVRTLACLPALTGAWEARGGGFLRQGWANGRLNLGALTDPRPGDPPARTVNMLHLGHALTELRDPPVMALYVYNSNPAAVAPAQAQVHAGLRREDLFVVVHEQMPTDTTDFADLVLPATTFLEQDDVAAGNAARYVQLARAAIAPLGEARSNLDTFAALAARLGIADPVYSEGFDALAERLLESDWAPPGGFDREAFRAGKPVKLHPPRAPWREGKLATPSGKFEFVSAALAAQGLSPVPEYAPSPEGHEAAAAPGASYPLQLCTPHAHHLINSSFANTPSAHGLERPATIRLHPADAAARGLAAGDAARAFNHRGACLLTVDVTEDVQPGVAVAESVWWPRHHAALTGADGNGSGPNGGPRPGNVNQLISAETTDLGGGALFQDCCVQVEGVEADSVHGHPIRPERPARMQG
jgi:anaerobic selenocysteine-containing dehydrogenase